MKALNKLVTLTALSLFVAAPAFATEAAPEASKAVEHSNAPATGTQVKGTERATEVGKGEEKGLEKQAAEVKEKGKSEAKKADKKTEEVAVAAPTEAAAPAAAAPAAPEKK